MVKLTCKIGDVTRDYSPIFDGDWVDQKTVYAIMADIQKVANNGKRFWFVDNGQASVLLFLSDQIAKALNKLAKRLISKCLPD